MKIRKLRLWNGRGSSRFENGKLVHYDYFYVCAYSRSDAVRLISSLGFDHVTDYEISTFYSPCWGDAMEGIKPERGLWGIPKGLRFSKLEYVRKIL